jgi:hypothetical protein
VPYLFASILCNFDCCRVAAADLHTSARFLQRKASDNRGIPERRGRTLKTSFGGTQTRPSRDRDSTCAGIVRGGATLSGLSLVPRTSFPYAELVLPAAAGPPSIRRVIAPAVRCLLTARGSRQLCSHRPGIAPESGERPLAAEMKAVNSGPGAA